MSVRVDDDGRLGALGEAALGAGAGESSVAYLTIGTGIGGGLVIDLRPYRGAHGLAGEVGHLVVDPDGPPCGCGGRGHVEAYAGGRGLASRAVLAWPTGRCADGSPAPIDADAVFRLARAGERVASRLVDEAVAALAIAIAALAATFDPGIIVVGGSIGVHQRRFVRSAVALARRRVLDETGRGLIVRPAALGLESVLAGASVMAAMRLDGGGDHEGPVPDGLRPGARAR
jgi:glucokinase